MSDRQTTEGEAYSSVAAKKCIGRCEASPLAAEGASGTSKDIQSR
jgi:hypothetical protein